jgi:diketogulonate reductase-like aldo/keto reductase
MDRRSFVIGSGALGLGLGVATLPASALALLGEVSRPIPSSGQLLPAVGMGTWITFNVGRSEKLRQARLKVLEEFFVRGGGLIDSSPMYGSSEEVIGWCLERIAGKDFLFSATKVWTVSQSGGISQMKTSQELWGERPLDLMQIHNLVDWQAHLETLKDRKADGRLRYLGITTSHGRRHDDMAAIMAAEPLDFVQFTYNIADRAAERRLLPLAADRGQAVIINRPFQGGRLIDRLARYPLPDWAAEIGCENWPQVLLKFVISHPAVTCAIPATSKVAHMTENMAAGYDPLPDAAMRKRMIEHVESL